MTAPYYHGERIYFRPVEPEDEPQLRRWVNDPRVWSTLWVRPPANSQTEQRWIEKVSQSETDFIFAVTTADTDRFIGVAGLKQIEPINRAATFGLMIGEVDQQNRGYGSEATELTLRFGFEQLNLNRIALSVFDSNPRARRVYEKAGFELEGRLQQALWRHGRYHDDLRYGILRERWQARHGRSAPKEAVDSPQPQAQAADSKDQEASDEQYQTADRGDRWWRVFGWAGEHAVR